MSVLTFLLNGGLYKKAHPNTVRDIHTENKKIATKLGIDDRVDTTANKDAFITLKDHKPNFANKPTCRLIKPTKPEIGKISKVTLDRINSKITRAPKFNQWKNSTSVIEWFKAIENKQHHSLSIRRFWGKGERLKRKRENVLSPSPLGRPDTQANNITALFASTS